MTQEVTSVPRVDLDRYLGTWYEICRLPMKYEDETASDITATYSLTEDGSIHVDNRCLDAEGIPSQSIGKAEAVDDTNAKLTVTFLPEFLRWIPFTKGDYWVLKLDPDYRHVLVGEPDRQFLWVLSRDPEMSAQERMAYLDHARALGYDLSNLITPQQSGGKVSEADLIAAGTWKG